MTRDSKVETKSGVLNIELLPYHGSFRRESTLTGGVDKLLNDFIKPRLEYTMFMTVANPEAVKLLQKEKKDCNSFLVEMYLGAISKIAKREAIESINYPMVRGATHRHPESGGWPSTHIVCGKALTVNRYMDITLNELNTPNVRELLDRNFSQIDILTKAKIEPLVLYDSPFRTEGETIRKILNFTSRFNFDEYGARREYSTIDED